MIDSLAFIQRVSERAESKKSCPSIVSRFTQTLGASAPRKYEISASKRPDSCMSFACSANTYGSTSSIPGKTSIGFSFSVSRAIALIRSGSRFMTTPSFVNGCVQAPFSQVAGGRQFLRELIHNFSFIFFVNFDHSTALNNVARYQ